MEGKFLIARGNVQYLNIVDYLKHPVAIQVKERLSAATKNIEPYAVQVGQHLQKQWNFLLKYIEGPVYDTSVEIAEQVSRRIVHTRHKIFLACSSIDSTRIDRCVQSKRPLSEHFLRLGQLLYRTFCKSNGSLYQTRLYYSLRSMEKVALLVFLSVSYVSLSSIFQFRSV